MPYTFFHIFSDPETARFKCDKCEYVTNKKLHMDAHTTTHTGESKFTCQKCGKCLTAASSLKRHMMAHKGENQITDMSFF